MLKDYSILFKGIFFSYLYIAVYLITGILITPMLLNYFEADYFALLMIIYAIITYINNFRFGLPESLAVLLAKSQDDIFNILLIRKNFIILITIVLFIIIILYMFGLFIDDWRFILGDVYSLNKKNVLDVFYILIIFALLKIPLDMSLSVFIGFHEIYIEKIYKIINLFVNSILVLFVINNGESIVFFALWAGLLDFLISAVSFIHIIIRYKIYENIDIKKSINSIDLLNSGLLFFQLSITQTIIWGSGIFLVSNILSLHDVTVYSLNMKVYAYIFYAYTIINTVIAPLYGKHLSNNSWNKIRNFFNTMIVLLPFIGGAIWIGMIYFMSDAIILWTGSIELYAGHVFVLFMGLFFYFTGYISSFITLLYSIGEIKSVIHLRWKEVIVNLIISSILIHLLGLLGTAIGMSLSAILVSICYLPQYIINKTNNKIILNFDIQKKHFILVLLPNVIIAFIVTNYISVLAIKLAIFLIIIMLYILLSWLLLSNKHKIYIMKLVNKNSIMPNE